VISKFFIEHPIFANVIALVTVIVGGVPLRAARRSVSRDRAADHPGEHAIPGRERGGGRGHDRVPLEHSDQRRRELNLHVVDQLQRRLVHPDHHLRRRDGPRHLPGLVQNLANSALSSSREASPPRGSRSARSPPTSCCASLYSRTIAMTRPFFSNYAIINLQNPLARIQGVARSGYSEPAPTACGSGWTEAPADLRAHDPGCAERHPGQNIEVVAGQIGGRRSRGSALPVHDQRPRPALRHPRVRRDHESSPVSGTAPHLVRLRDVAGSNEPAEFQQLLAIHRSQAAQIVVFALPGANAIQVADRVYKAMAEMSQQSPRA